MGMTFDEFAMTAARRVRTALVAAYGPDIGMDAAAEAAEPLFVLPSPVDGYQPLVSDLGESAPAASGSRIIVGRTTASGFDDIPGIADGLDVVDEDAWDTALAESAAADIRVQLGTLALVDERAPGVSRTFRPSPDNSTKPSPMYGSSSSGSMPTTVTGATRRRGVDWFGCCPRQLQPNSPSRSKAWGSCCSTVTTEPSPSST